MKNALICLLLVLVASSLPATTVTGKASPDKAPTWVGFLLDPIAGAQVTVTLEWSSKSAELFVLVVCDIGTIEVFGSGASTSMNRFQRVEAGVLGDLCAFSVSSFKGSSKFKMSIVDAGRPSVQPASTVGAARASSSGFGQLISMDASEWPEFSEKIERLRAFRQVGGSG